MRVTNNVSLTLRVPLTVTSTGYFTVRLKRFRNLNCCNLQWVKLGRKTQQRNKNANQHGYELYGETTFLRTEIRRTLLGEQINRAFPHQNNFNHFWVIKEFMYRPNQI